MFVPAAASGLPAARTISGRRSVPSTSPSIEPEVAGDERAGEREEEVEHGR